MARKRQEGIVAFAGWVASRAQISITMGLVIFLIACGTTAAPTANPAEATATAVPSLSPTPRSTAMPATPTNRPATPATPSVTSYPPVVQVAMTKLADFLRIPPGQVTVIRFEEHEWPDSSLGCPQPGGAYLMVITPGYRVFLAAEGREYEYHTDQKQNVVRCSG